MMNARNNNKLSAQIVYIWSHVILFGDYLLNSFLFMDTIYDKNSKTL